MDAVLPTYQASYAPSAELSIDESLTPFKGRLGFKQYLPLKPKKWGVKFFVLADAATGFCLDWHVYTGKQNGVNSGEGLTGRIVKQLAEPYYRSGKTVFMDNFYSSPQLFLDLKEQEMGACGTVRMNRRGLPAEMKTVSVAQRKGDEPAFFRKGDLLGVTWHDVKRCTVLSTVHGNGTVQKEIRKKGAENGVRLVNKPAAVDGYNQAMGGVDLLDQRMSYYRYPHRHMRWYMVIFLLEVALVNAFLAFKLAHGNESTMTTRKLRLEVINSLCST